MNASADHALLPAWAESLAVLGGLPETRDERWKYTSLRALAQQSFAPGDACAAARAVDAAWLAPLPGFAAPTLVFVNGVCRADLSTMGRLPKGMTLTIDAAPVAATRFSQRSEGFARLNAQAARQGLTLRLDAGVNAVVRLLCLGVAAEAAVIWHLRHAIELAPGASLTLLEQHLATGQDHHLATQLSDIVLHDGARLEHVVLQQAATTSQLMRRSDYHLNEHSEARLHLLELGGALARHDLNVALAGEGASFLSRGVFIPKGRQHSDTQLAVRHTAKHTRSEALWRGVAAERGRGVLRGAIMVAVGADGSDAILSNKNLLLSAQAEIDTKPELEIHADEVKAAHGATVGQLDARALFYLRSRGIAEAEARALLTTAFCRAVLDDVPNETLREFLAGKVETHLS